MLWGGGQATATCSSHSQSFNKGDSKPQRTVYVRLWKILIDFRCQNSRRDGTLILICRLQLPSDLISEGQQWHPPHTNIMDTH